MWMTKSFWAHSGVGTHGHYMCMVVFWHVTIPGLITDMLSSSFRVYSIKSHARHKQDRGGEGKRETVDLRPIYRQYMWFGAFSLCYVRTVTVFFYVCIWSAMRLVSMQHRVRRAAESEEESKPAPPPPSHHSHNFLNMKNKFFNELSHLPSK